MPPVWENLLKGLWVRVSGSGLRSQRGKVVPHEVLWALTFDHCFPRDSMTYGSDLPRVFFVCGT